MPRSLTASKRTIALLVTALITAAGLTAVVAPGASAAAMTPTANTICGGGYKVLSRQKLQGGRDVGTLVLLRKGRTLCAVTQKTTARNRKTFVGVYLRIDTLHKRGPKKGKYKAGRLHFDEGKFPRYAGPVKAMRPKKGAFCVRFAGYTHAHLAQGKERGQCTRVHW